MEHYTVIVVGGGPGGSSCGRKLAEAGVDTLILDQAEFPREKRCGGWITPSAVSRLELDTVAYPHRFDTFRNIQVRIKGLELELRTVQHLIRRFEFDDYLLQQAVDVGCVFKVHKAGNVQRRDGLYVIDDQYAAKFVVGAGGTGCPVYRDLFRERYVRPDGAQIVTLETEFPFDWEDVCEENCAMSKMKLQSLLRN